MTYTIVLYGDVPSKKNSKDIFRTAAGRPFITSSKAFKAWEEEQMWMIKGQWKNKQTLPGSPRVIMTFYPSTHRRADATNKGEGVMDLLVKAGILPDDNWFVVPEVTSKLGGVDPEKPRVEISIDKIIN